VVSLSESAATRGNGVKSNGATAVDLSMMPSKLKLPDLSRERADVL